MAAYSTGKPLEGVRVLELARILAGPWAAQMLADLGADVVKVERPGQGDDTRSWGPPFIEAADGGDLSSAYFHSANRGKRSIAVDFTSVAGAALVRRLACVADVVIENFKPGALARYELDHASLLQHKPDLITCSITGFGQTGPYADRAGYDAMIQAMGGIMDLTGDPAGEPQKIGVAYADLFTGTYAAVGILAALRRRDATGQGAHLDMALLDVQTGVLANQAMNFLSSGEVPHRMGNAHPNIVPYQLFETSDGPIMIACGNDAQFARLASLLGVAGLSDDPKYRSNPDRVANRDELVTILAARCRLRSRADLLQAMEHDAVPAGPINDVGALFADPQVIARGMRRDIPSTDAKSGTIPAVRTPIVLDGIGMIAGRPSPRLDADRSDILRSWGIDP